MISGCFRADPGGRGGCPRGAAPARGPGPRLVPLRKWLTCRAPLARWPWWPRA